MLWLQLAGYSNAKDLGLQPCSCACSRCGFEMAYTVVVLNKGNTTVRIKSSYFIFYGKLFKSLRVHWSFYSLRKLESTNT